MKFKKIILKNFRQFKGVNKIDFSTSDDKNITVIYGGITHGKTTLLQSFNWVLYNEVTLQNSADLLNYELVSEMKAGDNAEVSAELYVIKDENGEEEFKFSRVQNYIMSPEMVLYPTSTYSTVERKSNDTWQTYGNFQDEVSKILPENLSSYFFFDGERIDTISKEQRQGSSEVGKSVKSILGLEHFNSAIKHLSGGSGSRYSVIGELRNKINAGTNTEMAQLKSDLIRYGDNLEQSEIKVKAYEEEIEKLEDQKKSKEIIIENNKETYKKQMEKNSLKNKLANLKVRKERLYQNYTSYFNNYYIDFFYYGLNEKLNKLFDSGLLNKTTEAVPNMHQKSIEYILNRGYCLCGEKFIEGDSHYNALIEEMKKLPPQSIGTTIAEFKKDSKKFVSQLKSENFKNEIISRYKEISENKEEIIELQDKIDSISNDIQTNVNVGSLEREVREIEERIKLLSTRKGMELSRQESIKIEQKKAEDKIGQIAQYDENNKIIQNQIDYAEHISKKLSTNYMIRERQLVYTLEKEINKYLKMIYTGERLMKITSDYKFKLIYADGEEDKDSPESEGLGNVKAISFMCGLLEVAKNKILDEVEVEAMYPLVFDAPLSKIDSVHRKNVMSCLPNVASQVIVFTREKKDLEDITDETKAKIGKEYYINKISEKYSKVSDEEEDD